MPFLTIAEKYFHKVSLQHIALMNKFPKSTKVCCHGN